MGDSGIPMVDEGDDEVIPMVDEWATMLSHRTELGATKRLLERLYARSP